MNLDLSVSQKSSTNDINADLKNLKNQENKKIDNNVTAKQGKVAPNF